MTLDLRVSNNILSCQFTAPTTIEALNRHVTSTNTFILGNNFGRVFFPYYQYPNNVTLSAVTYTPSNGLFQFSDVRFMKNDTASGNSLIIF